MYPDMMLKSVLERDKLSKTMIFFQGVYDTLDLFTDSLIEAFSQMGMETFVYHASHQEKSKEDFRKEFLELVRRGINTGMTEEELMTLVQKGYEEEQR